MSTRLKTDLPLVINGKTVKQKSIEALRALLDIALVLLHCHPVWPNLIEQYASHRRQRIGPGPVFVGPEVRATKCLRTMQETLLDRHADRERGRLALDRGSPQKLRISRDPRAAVDPQLVHPTTAA
jgi:hypothetical protein